MYEAARAKRPLALQSAFRIRPACFSCGVMTDIQSALKRSALSIDSEEPCTEGAHIGFEAFVQGVARMSDAGRDLVMKLLDRSGGDR